MNKSVIGQLRHQNEKIMTKLTEAERQLVLAREVVEERNKEVEIQQQELFDLHTKVSLLT